MAPSYKLNKCTHDEGGAVEAIPEGSLQELHHQVHHVVGGEGLDDAQRARKPHEHAESGATTPAVGR